MKIKNITAKKIIASLGNDTVEATIEFDDGTKSTASVPAGLSAGKYEIKKVTPDEAIREIGEIREICKDKDWTQKTLDKEISSHNFGGNSTLAVSAAFYKAGHSSFVTSHLPKLMLLLFEGAKHGTKSITMQEFMVVEDSFEQAVRDFRTIREYLESKDIETTVGAEGAFSPKGFTNEKCLEIIKTVLPDKQISIDMADSFGDSQIPEGVFSIEDPFNDEDWDKWVELTSRHQSLVIGDDLTTTNPERIKKAIELKACDGIVIKPNQIGTISAAKEAVKLCKEANLKTVVSHRGEETDDWWIADFAVDVAADFVKFGGMDRGERVAKYNRLIELKSV